MEEKYIPWLITIKKKKSQVFFSPGRKFLLIQFLRHILRECQKLTLIRMIPCENICQILTLDTEDFPPIFFKILQPQSTSGLMVLHILCSVI